MLRHELGELENFNAHASMSFTGLSVGTHTITANYSSGDSIHDSETSTLYIRLVSFKPIPRLPQMPGSSTLASRLLSRRQSSTQVAVLSCRGTVTFREGSNVLGTTIANGSGVATFTTSSLPVNGYSVTATYDGDGQHHASTSSSLSQSVLGIPTVVSLSASAGSTAYGNSVTLTATVTNGLASILDQPVP